MASSMRYSLTRLSYSKMIKKNHYIDTPGISRKRKQLKQYNDFINNSKITVVLNSDVTVSIRFLVLFLYQYLIKSTVRIISVDLTQPSTPIQYPHNQNLLNINYILYHSILSTMTQRKQRNTSSIVPITDSAEGDVLMNYIADLNVFARGFSGKKDADAYLNKEYCLKDMGIERLEFQLA